MNISNNNWNYNNNTKSSNNKTNKNNNKYILNLVLPVSQHPTSISLEISNWLIIEFQALAPAEGLLGTLAKQTPQNKL